MGLLRRLSLAVAAFKSISVDRPVYWRRKRADIYAARPLVTPTRSVSEDIRPFPRLRFGLVWDVSLLTACSIDIRGLLRQIRLAPRSARVADPAVRLNVRLLCSLLDRPTSLAAFRLHPFPPSFVVLDVLSFVLKSRLRLDGLIRPIPFRCQSYRDSFVLLDALSFVSGIRLDSRRLGFRARLFFLRSVLNNRLACLFHPCG